MGDPAGAGPAVRGGAYVERISAELGAEVPRVRAALDLLLAGNTIPFVARYRKEATGSLDEVQLRDIRDRHEYLSELEARRGVIIASIDEQGRLTPDLREALLRANSKSDLEDLYRPHRPKRRTRATMAAEQGLLPLAEMLASGRRTDAQLHAAASAFVNPAREVPGVTDALAGARDIFAERVADDPALRRWIRSLTFRKGTLESRPARGRETEASKFRDYHAFSQPLRELPGHRILAIRRGEAEGMLSARVVAPAEEIVAGLHRRLVRASSAPQQMALAVEDGYHRLIAPSIEVELRAELKERADEEAIGIFGQNLEALLLSSPAGERRVLGVDPGFRTGCKLAVVGPTGALLGTGQVYLHQPDRAASELRRMILEHAVELVAIGNGTASREADRMVRDTVAGLSTADRPTVVMVSEAGASVYSASDLAREELPELDLTLRSAVSIARRLQDPLAELVKLDPKAIGVGQYQHDVSQPRLKRRLDETVESCVNRVGVELNTASPALLGYVAGIGPAVAHRIVETRDRAGPFRSRRDILEVPGLGRKTFEQSAGFLRVRGAEHPLDSSAVHPERYPLVERMATDVGVRVQDLVGNEPAIGRIDPRRYVSQDVGLPTLEDIVAELRKPGRDPRSAFEAPAFREDVRTMEDLREGMALEGTVTNVVAFGAFVDVGVHQDGLVHVSQLSGGYVRDPSDVVRVGDCVVVRVVSVDLPRKRIGLSMKGEPGRGGEGPAGSPRG